MIGVSACLGGCPVRYDGQDQKVAEIADRVKQKRAIQFVQKFLVGYRFLGRLQKL